DGAPGGGLIFDAAGNLYGAAAGNGGIGTATVFKLTANSDGTWTESVLFKFFGGYPEAGLIFDAAGNLYGTTIQPGLQGTVFELSPTSDGGWTESTLFTFGGRDGANPLGGLIFDAAGNLYGTTAGGGSSSTECTSGGHNGCGVVFKLAPNPDGTWTESVLHTFLGEPSEYPSAGLTMDAAGNLYGTTNGGGTNYGSVFKLTPTSSGWSYTVLHRFLGLPGEYPYAGVIMDAAGNLYGTTSEGSTNYGLVFEITPCGF
ncbi:MAG: choice-of-anchor tandem repeat GloVer-containing protein, partial [Candidatus Sulfotelmatobacter sp.]